MSEQSNASGRELQPHRPPEGITESDYEAIEDAVMETARGRWFLKEYARRMRAAETASLRSALERIERIVSSTHAPHADAMTQAQARERIESVSERLLDISWYMRERGFAGAVCASIDEEARQLGAAAELLAGRSEPEVEPAASSHGAQVEDAPSQDGVVIEGEVEVERPEPVSEPAPQMSAPAEDHAPAHEDAAAEARSMVDRAHAFAHVDALPMREKLVLFG